MAIIWGFDLSEMRWSAFGHKAMFDRRWHLKRERAVLYQLAMNVCLAAECTATYSLSKYEDLQTNIESYSNHTASVHNNDIIAAQCLTIVSCVLVATLFGADFFFLIFWPRRKYPRWYNITKLALAVGITLTVWAAALMSTVVVATNSSRITGVDAATAKTYTDFFYRPPLQYSKWAVNIAYVVVLWLGWCFTVAATIVMFKAARHDGNAGTGSAELIPSTSDNEVKNVPSDIA